MGGASFVRLCKEALKKAYDSKTRASEKDRRSSAKILEGRLYGDKQSLHR